MLAPRTVDKLIEQQVRRWEASLSRRPNELLPDPVIAVSRLPGCYGGSIAFELAHRLGFDFFDHEILHKVAQSAHLSDAILGTLDEKTLSRASEFVESLLLERYLCGDYFRHLSKVLMAIAAHGRAVILGRGASLILKPECCVRVLLVSPFNERVRAVAEHERVTCREAARRLICSESERRAFIQRHFHADMMDPTRYDLVVNLAGLGRETALTIIQSAWEGKRSRARVSV
jgi:cytidylate kinase